jgi:hypothetical protein
MAWSHRLVLMTGKPKPSLDDIAQLIADVAKATGRVVNTVAEAAGTAQSLVLSSGAPGSCGVTVTVDIGLIQLELASGARAEWLLESDKDVEVTMKVLGGALLGIVNGQVTERSTRCLGGGSLLRADIVGPDSVLLLRSRSSLLPCLGRSTVEKRFASYTAV